MFSIRTDGELAERHARIETALRAALALKRVAQGRAVTLHDETSRRDWSVGREGTIRPGAAATEDFMVELRQGGPE